MRWLLIAAVMGAGCAPQRPTPDFYIDGIGVKIQSGARDWTRAPEFDAQFLAIADAATAYGEIDRSALRGWVVVFSDVFSVSCPGVPGGNGIHTGCMDESGWMEIGLAPSLTLSSLVHEILHVAIGDYCHRDPRWRDFAPVVDALEQTAIYGETTIYPDPWRTWPSC